MAAKLSALNWISLEPDLKTEPSPLSFRSAPLKFFRMEPVQPPRVCIYCGAENDAVRRDCSVCHNTLLSEQDLAEATDQFLPVDQPPDISHLPLNFKIENGFSYPDWKTVDEAVCKTLPEEEWWAAFHELAKQWLVQLKADLGGYYRCYESNNVLLLCAEGTDPSQTILGYAENSRAALRQHCQPLLAQKLYGKHAILAFAEQDDYYTCISHFYPDGAHSLSWGIMLSRGYMHIAFPFTWVFSAKRVITHELVHNCIAHLPVPTWLHEGLARKLETLAGNPGFSLDADLAVRHCAFWTEEKIQQFWSGASFYVPGESNELSYSLANILLELICNPWERFLEFVREADYRDAGQDASLKILGRCLGETLGTFLGPGNWRPQRKTIAEHRRKRAEAKPDDGG